METQPKEIKKEIKMTTPDQGIATDIVLNMIIRYRDNTRQALTGEIPGVPLYELSPKDKRFSSVAALTLLAATQKEMVIYTKPFLMSKPDQKDYDVLKYVNSFLKQSERSLRLATWTKTKKDDFIEERENPNTRDKEYYLTENFYDILEDLEDSYETIFDIMLRNGLINATLEDKGRKPKNNAIR